MDTLDAIRTLQSLPPHIRKEALKGLEASLNRLRCAGCDNDNEFVGAEGYCGRCWSVANPLVRRLQRLTAAAKEVLRFLPLFERGVFEKGIGENGL